MFQCHIKCSSHSLFTCPKKNKTVHKRRHSRTATDEDLRGDTKGKNIFQTPGRNWMGGWIQDLTTTLFYKHCSYKKTLKRTDRSENAQESTGKEEMETKRKPLPCKKGT